jgi:hypothetical protein
LWKWRIYYYVDATEHGAGKTFKSNRGPYCGHQDGEAEHVPKWMFAMKHSVLGTLGFVALVVLLAAGGSWGCGQGGARRTTTEPWWTDKFPIRVGAIDYNQTGAVIEGSVTNGTEKFLVRGSVGAWGLTKSGETYGWAASVESLAPGETGWFTIRIGYSRLVDKERLQFLIGGLGDWHFGDPVFREP